MIKTESPSKLFSQLIDYKSFGNQKKFAESIGVAPQVIQNIVSGRKSKPSYDLLNSISSTFDDINPDWLITGRGDMIKSEVKPSPAPTIVDPCAHRVADIKELYLLLLKEKDKIIEMLEAQVTEYKATNKTLQSRMSELYDIINDLKKDVLLDKKMAGLVDRFREVFFKPNREVKSS